jgi:putative transposase
LTADGKTIISVVMVGFASHISSARRLTSDLEITALDMALITRKSKGVIHHSDQDRQYTSIAFGNRCKEMNVRPSMGNPAALKINEEPRKTGD